MSQTGRKTDLLVAPNEQRRRLMASVRRSGTGLEVQLRLALHRAGLRYRLRGGRGLPGSPDLIFRKSRVAIFVDGCFWHGCRQHGTMPKTNAAFWKAKFVRNRKRDQMADRELAILGWTVVRIWEHELRADLSETARELRRVVRRLELRSTAPSE